MADITEEKVVPEAKKPLDEPQLSDPSSQTPPTELTAPYSIYGRKERWILVAMVAVTGMFSPLPANIYFPALPTLAEAFNRSVEDINLTVTIYLAMQGCSPMLWGPLSDRYGRRPLFLLCLLILAGSSLGLALCPTSAFWLLLLLRAVQAGGCASMIALGAGLIGDIATVEERGGYFGMFNLGPMLAPCIGPAVGGALSEHLGWRSIFWFLLIVSGGCFVVVLLFLPETMRALVGDGSWTPRHWMYQPLTPIVGRKRSSDTEVGPGQVDDSVEVKKRSSVNPFHLFVYPDILLTLLYTGVVYAVNYTITSTISSSFAATYPYLSETLLGICYLSTGLGMILGSTITGKLLDLDYARLRRKRGLARAGDDSTEEDDDDFPIEYARLRMMPTLLVIFVACVVGWGWCIQFGTSIAGPLVLQVILGYTSIAILNTTMTLMVDIIKNQSSGVTACTNFVRCSLAAILVSVIDKATQSRLGYGWTYTLLGGLCALLLPVLYAEIRWGPKWRMERDRKKVN
ncbi:Uu.00g139550.m01.CDS01 [Anthostomella pinea]|uniref:Uu.00g139550.m01.CDS01 n=1 Tax=Anthostomella pinea TaxID=933095 RepID=A0AAI8YLB7_9PEZI|nr:Uu.00g139550.m01.CDS01 [Anthostomella pinea]